MQGVQFPVVLAVMALVTCQAVCLTHCHADDHLFHHRPGHHNGPADGERGDSHGTTGHGGESNVPQHLHGHSGLDDPVKPDRLAFLRPAGPSDSAIVEPVPASKTPAEGPEPRDLRALTEIYGFTFLGRSPTGC